MAQTKRKRKSKHRGNAAGGIEARGRTSRKQHLSPAEQKKADRAAARDRRTTKPPSWKSAALKAGLMALLLFALTQAGFLGKSATISSSAVLAVFAFIAYTPLAYATDRFVYQRQQRKRAAQRGH